MPLNTQDEELKSIRTDPAHRDKGIASALLNHAAADAIARGVRRIHLETGNMAFFAPARALYRRHGFTPCEPFDHYVEDPNSVYMTLELSHGGQDNCKPADS